MDNLNFSKNKSTAVSIDGQVATTEFIRKTYLHVALAVLLFIAVEYLFLSSEFIRSLGIKMVQGSTWLFVLAGFMFVTGMAERWALTSTDRNQQYLALILYVVAQAFIFVPLLMFALYMSDGVALIGQAGIITLGLFTGLTAVVFFTGQDFSFLRTALMVGSFIALGLIVAGILFGFDLGIWFAFAMVLLAAGSILYQTSNMIHRYNREQYVAAALGLFASLMLMFWYVLSILMSRD